MRSHLAATLRAIESPRWSFDLLVPRLRRALAARSGADPEGPCSTFGLCLEAFGARHLAAVERDYVRVGDGPILIGGESMRPDQRALWRSSLKWVAPRAAMADVVASDAPVERVRQAMAWLERRDPASAAVLRSHVEYVCCIDGVDFTSSSHPRCMGVLFVHARPALAIDELAVILIHEAAHQELFLVNTQDRLVRPEADGELRHAPLQGRPRPVIGRLHAAHALWRMLEAERRMDHRHVPGLRRDLAATLMTLSDSLLTEFGGRLVTEVYAPAAAATAEARC